MSDPNVDDFADLLADQSNVANAKTGLVNEIRRLLAQQGLSQTQAAARLGMSQADLSKLLRGKLPSCSLDRLMRILTKLGHKVVIQSHQPLPNESAAIEFRGNPPWTRRV